MVNVNKLSAEMQKELVFTKEELAELERAKKMPITFDANIQINNPNKQKAELNTLEWTLFIKNIEVANGVLNEEIEIEANESKSFPIEVQTNTIIFSVIGNGRGELQHATTIGNFESLRRSCTYCESHCT